MRVLMLITIAIALIAVASLPGTTAHEELDLRVTHGEVQTNETVVYQGDTVDFSIWIYNDAASAETQVYSLHMESRDHIVSKSLSNVSVVVEYRTEENVRLRLETPRTKGLGECVVKVHVVSDKDANVTGSVQITVNVIERIDKGISVYLGERRIVLEPGQTGLVQVNITNEYNVDRDIVVTAFSSSSMTDVSIDSEHTIRAGRTLELIMYVHAGEISEAFISVHVVTTETAEIPVWRHVNVTVVEDVGVREERESSSPPGPAANTIIGFTIGYLIAMFATVVLLRNRFPGM